MPKQKSAPKKGFIPGQGTQVSTSDIIKIIQKFGRLQTVKTVAKKFHKHQKQ